MTNVFLQISAYKLAQDQWNVQQNDDVQRGFRCGGQVSGVINGHYILSDANFKMNSTLYNCCVIDYFRHGFIEKRAESLSEKDLLEVYSQAGLI